MSSTSTQTDNVERILRDVGMTPRGVQVTAIETGILLGRSIMVCSPTGSGKTLVGEMALLRAITSGERGLYLVPLRALAYQVVNLLKERYSNLRITIGLSTGDYQTDGSSLEEYDILVTTYERADSLLRHRVSWLSEIGTVVIDEVQNISRAGRGARLESVIIRLKRSNPELQLIALSATVGMPYELAEWLGCELIESDERPVPLISKVFTAKDRTKSVRELVMSTVQSNGQVIVFHRTRREAEAEATRLAKDVGRQLRVEERGSIDLEMDSLEHWDTSLPPELKVVIHDGIAYHHAGLGARARRLVERMFLKGMIRVICATTTLASGMDLPARTVVLASARSPLDYRQILPTNQVHQMLGRAGRPGRDRKGFGIILVGSRGEADRIKRRYFIESEDSSTGKLVLTPRYDSVSSVLNHPLSMTEQLLVALDDMKEASLEEIEGELFGESYLVHCSIRDTKAPMRALHLGAITAVSAIEMHALADTVRPARDGVLATVKIRESSPSVLGGIVSGLDGGHQTCRFSARQTTDGSVEGPLCSCERPIDSGGILCPHLVALGFYAANHYSTLADYVIPLSLSESSPLGTLKRLNLIEGGESGKYRPTRLGRLTNRLYISIPTARELLAMLPLAAESTELLWLLRHLLSVESGVGFDDSFEQMIAMVATTDMPFREIAKATGMHLGDLVGHLDTSMWLLYAIAVLANEGNLESVVERAQNLLSSIDARLQRNEVGGIEDDDS